jgi:hypothetical protein
MAPPTGGKDWADGSDTDPGVTLVELLAYVGDLLSYYQDRVADEARLRTRRRYAVSLALLALFLSWSRCRTRMSVS